MTPARPFLAPAVAVAAALAAGLGGCRDDGPAEPNPSSTVTLRTELTGAAEIPGPGDPDGRGTATIRLDFDARQVCFELETSGIDAATAAHVHAGPAGASGDVRVPLEPPSHGAVSGCAGADGFLMGQIAANPSGFYVNVHTAAHPDGAIRGQLGA